MAFQEVKPGHKTGAFGNHTFLIPTADTPEKEDPAENLEAQRASLEELEANAAENSLEDKLAKQESSVVKDFRARAQDEGKTVTEVLAEHKEEDQFREDLRAELKKDAQVEQKRAQEVKVGTPRADVVSAANKVGTTAPAKQETPAAKATK